MPSFGVDRSGIDPLEPVTTGSLRVAQFIALQKPFVVKNTAMPYNFSNAYRFRNSNFSKIC